MAIFSLEEVPPRTRMPAHPKNRDKDTEAYDKYIEYIKNKNPDCVISQPCPALVSFIETYRPELIKYLAPADSPMLHCAKMIKEFYTKYTGYKIAAISPCYAKRREFDETGICDYNVTMRSIQSYMEEK